MKNIFAIMILSVLVFNACYYDNEEELYPSVETGCNTVYVTFSNTIYNILSSRCLACHSKASADSYGDGIVLEDYNNVKIAAESGRFLGSIKHEDGYAKMPLGADKLDDCKISQIEAWIEAGMPEN